jgi:hypothetical protein
LPPDFTLADLEALTTCCSLEEKQYLVDNKFAGASELIEAITSHNYQKIREFKSKFYPDKEKMKLQQLQYFFGEGIRTYFFDKVHTTRPLSERFRPPYGALEQYKKIISLVKIVENQQ